MTFFDVVLVSLLLILKIFHTLSSVSIVDLEQAIASGRFPKRSQRMKHP